MTALVPYINGALSAIWLTAALFFVRYWLLAKDELFLWFASAFLTFAAHSVIRTFDVAASDHAHFIYLIRLLGFVMILIGILRKNRR
jgi:hypothetical protein